MNLVNLFMDEIYNIFMHRDFRFDEKATQLFEKLNKECSKGQEIDLQHVMNSYKHLHRGELLEAIRQVDKVLMNNDFDPQGIMYARSLLQTIHNELIKLAKEDIKSPQIAPVFEALWVRGMVGLEAHSVVADHYEALGNVTKAECIRAKIKAVLPNYLTRKAA